MDSRIRFRRFHTRYLGGEKLKLTVLAGLGSPWSYAAIEAIAKAGAEVHVVHVPPERDEAYIDPTTPAWRERIERLESIVLTRREPEIGSGKLRYLRLGHWLARQEEVRSSHAVLSLYCGGLGLAATCSRHKKVVLYAVGSDILRIGGLNKFLTRWCLQRAQLVFANGQYLSRETQRLAPKARVESLLLGVDTEVFVPGRAVQPRRLVCTRGFKPVYNNLSILKAIALLPADVPAFNMVFVAGGELLTQAQKWADAHLHPDRRGMVEFRGGVGPSEVLQSLQESEIFVSMSRSDGTATSLLEALSCGLHPVLSDIPANQEWAQEGELVHPDDVMGLTQRLDAALRQPKFDKEMLRGRVTQVADASTNMAALVDRLRRL